MTDANCKSRRTALLPAVCLTLGIVLLAGCEPVQNTRPSEQGAVSVPVPLPEGPPIVISDLAPEDRGPLTAPSNAPLPIEGDVLTAGQVLDRLRARLSHPTCIVGPNNTRWRHKYAGYPRHFASQIQETLPRMLVVLDALEAHHLPAEFATIPIVESWYRLDVRSFAGAAGMWQFLAQTARNNGAVVSSDYDGRMSMLDSTDAAMSYLGMLDSMFHDWRLVGMAYNSGEFRLAKTMTPGELAARGAGSIVRYRRPGGLAFATYEYVSKMRALICMLDQPERQGIPIDPTVPVTHWVRYTVPPGIDSIDDLAQRLGTDADELKSFNGGYRYGRIGPDAPRDLLVPASTRPRWASVASAQPAAPVASPASPASAAVPTPAPTTHTGPVAGVTASPPAAAIGPPTPTQPALRSPASDAPTAAIAHPIDTRTTAPAGAAPAASIHPADRPPGTTPSPTAPGTTPSPTAPGTTPSPTAPGTFRAPAPPASNTPAPTAAPPPMAAAQGPIPAQAPRTYKVQMGDSLQSIAQRFGLTVDNLRAWNHLAADATLDVDQMLKLEP
ncbi:MAG: LysM peptidoglycan-binding domain-containing protein [Proteobacteria bacterium]|nr:LysM peptidoglycan-binding domain-containing protein [Pseudomonadota bacterium]